MRNILGKKSWEGARNEKILTNIFLAAKSTKSDKVAAKSTKSDKNRQKNTGSYQFLLEMARRPNIPGILFEGKARNNILRTRIPRGRIFKFGGRLFLTP